MCIFESGWCIEQGTWYVLYLQKALDTVTNKTLSKKLEQLHPPLALKGGYTATYHIKSKV